MAITSGNPKPKPAKKAYGKSHQDYIGNPAMQGGKTAKAKADLKKAIKGGAAKTAKKLKPRDATKTLDGYNSIPNKNIKSTSPSQQAKRNMIAGNIINDKSKTAMRAKIVEMNAVKKANKR
jgi:hypothetical protein